MTMYLGRAAILCALVAVSATAIGCGDDGEGGGGGGAASTATEARAPDVRFQSALEDGLPVCYAEPQPKNLTIGFANPLDAQEAVNAEARAMKLETERLGGKFISVDAKAQPDLQVSAVEQFIARKVDAMIIYPLDPKALDPVLKRAKAAGIPTIGIEANLESRDPGLYTSQVWLGRDYAGYLTAKEAVRLMGPGAKYVQAGFAVPVPTIEKALERNKYWADKFGLRYLGRGNNPTDDIAGGEKVMIELMAKHPDAQGLLAYSEQTATGAAAALRAQGKRDFPLIGANGGSVGFESVQNGKIDATIRFDVPGVGRCTVWGAYDAAEGKQIPRTVRIERPRVLNKVTIDQEKTWDDELEERYGKTG